MATQFIIRSTSLAILSYFQLFRLACCRQKSASTVSEVVPKTFYRKGVGKGRISRMNMEYDKAASRNAFFTDYRNAKTENRFFS